MAGHLHKQGAWQQAKTEVFAEETGFSQRKVFMQWSFKPIPAHSGFLFRVLVQQGATSQVVYCFILKRTGLRLQKVGGTVSNKSLPVQKGNGMKRVRDFICFLKSSIRFWPHFLREENSETSSLFYFANFYIVYVLN